MVGRTGKAESGRKDREGRERYSVTCLVLFFSIVVNQTKIIHRLN